MDYNIGDYALLNISLERSRAKSLLIIGEIAEKEVKGSSVTLKILPFNSTEEDDYYQGGGDLGVYMDGIVITSGGEGNYHINSDKIDDTLDNVAFYERGDTRGLKKITDDFVEEIRKRSTKTIVTFLNKGVELPTRDSKTNLPNIDYELWKRFIFYRGVLGKQETEEDYKEIKGQFVLVFITTREEWKKREEGIIDAYVVAGKINDYDLGLDKDKATITVTLLYDDKLPPKFEISQSHSMTVPINDYGWLRLDETDMGSSVIFYLKHLKKAPSQIDIINFKSERHSIVNMIDLTRLGSDTETKPFPFDKAVKSLGFPRSAKQMEMEGGAILVGLKTGENQPEPKAIIVPVKFEKFESVDGGSEKLRFGYVQSESGKIDLTINNDGSFKPSGNKFTISGFEYAVVWAKYYGPQLITGQTVKEVETELRKEFSNITIESEPVSEPEPEPVSKPIFEPKPESQSEAEPESEPESGPEPKAEPLSEAEPEPETLEIKAFEKTKTNRVFDHNNKLKKGDIALMLVSENNKLQKHAKRPKILFVIGKIDSADIQQNRTNKIYVVPVGPTNVRLNSMDRTWWVEEREFVSDEWKSFSFETIPDKYSSLEVMSLESKVLHRDWEGYEDILFEVEFYDAPVYDDNDPYDDVSFKERVDNFKKKAIEKYKSSFEKFVIKDLVPPVLSYTEESGSEESDSGESGGANERVSETEPEAEDEPEPESESESESEAESSEAEDDKFDMGKYAGKYSLDVSTHTEIDNKEGSDDKVIYGRFGDKLVPKAELEDCENRVSKYREKLKKGTNELEKCNLKVSLFKKNNRRGTLDLLGRQDSEIREKNHEINTLKGKLGCGDKSLEACAQGFKQKLDKLQKTNARAEKVLKLNGQNVEKLKSLTERLSQMREHAERVEAQNKECESQNQSLTNEIDRLKSQFVKEREELESVRKQLTEKEDAIEEVNATIKANDTKINQLKAQIAELESKEAESNINLDEGNEAIAKLREETQELLGLNELLISRIKIFEEEADTLISTVQEQESKIKAQTERIQKLDLVLENAKDDKEEIDSLKKSNKSLQFKYKRSETFNESLQSENNQFKLDNSAINTTNGFLQTEIVKIKKENGNLEKQNKKLRNTSKGECRVGVDNLKAEFEVKAGELQRQVELSNENAINSRSLLENSEKGLIQCKERVKTLRGEQAGFQAKIDDATQKLDECAESRLTKQDELTSTNKQLKECTDKNSELTASQLALTSEVKSLKNEIVASEGNEKLQWASMRLLQTANDDLTSKNKQFEVTQKQLDGCTKSKSILETTVESLEKEVQSSKETIESLRVEIAKLGSKKSNKRRSAPPPAPQVIRTVSSSRPSGFLGTRLNKELITDLSAYASLAGLPSAYLG